MFKGSNMNTLVQSVLPDNRPITSLQIVDNYEKCPKGFLPVHRTHDQDADADLWRETIIFAKRRTTRYLCLSKSEGLPLYVIETLKVIGEKEMPPAGFSLLSRTADTDQKAWRKRQIAYKLSKRGTISQAVTDIILCSRLRTAPLGFELAGEINGVIVCYKLGICTHRDPPSVPRLQTRQSLPSDVENAMHYMNVSSRPYKPLPSQPEPTADNYENIQINYQLPATTEATNNGPRLPARQVIVYSKTLSLHSDIDGVPFILDPRFAKPAKNETISSSMFDPTPFEYNFQLERQVLCTTKAASTNKNPFFHEV